jgi:adenosylcobinamide-GDP ribazoletransferase
MTLIRSIIIAFAMFSKIPMPEVNWDKANMKYALAGLPLAGLIIGGLQWAILKFSPFDIILTAVLLTVIPVIITGGVHLDGFCDTVDALSSHGSAEKKRAILEDPHCGAFAVIWASVYLLVYFGICTEIEPSYAIISIPVMSRTAGAFATLMFPSAKNGGLLDTFKESSSKASLAVCLLWFIASAWFAPLPAAAMLFCGLYVRFMGKKQFGGMSGDIAGYLICICEVFGLGALLIWGLI